MGIAVTSGVLATLDAKAAAAAPIQHAKWESHTPGTTTPRGLEDETLPSQFIACVTREESAKRLRNAFASPNAVGCRVEVLVSQNVKAAQASNVILLWWVFSSDLSPCGLPSASVSCKPQQAHDILNEPGMKEALDGKLLISILAGVTIAQMSALVYPATKVIRAMPNTPTKIREGMTVVSTLPPSSTFEIDRSIILNIFSSIGRCRFLEEKHFDACTALSGSGPAFACIFLEAMADGGVMMGLPRAEAIELAAQTLQGAARMTLSGIHPAQLKDSVTTPGGCTIAGLLALEDGKVRSTIARAIQIATERASELGQPTKH
ncbi:uncharacterized protein FIBRA_04496 [Fibroporia radiculosa]|uniref:Pyrroline-5-carboxylate reductase n=1 Tax=Fibroporia radiculosa TaxID=599839 RepID=J4G7H2_9APHY|nr:uncharacterized protein FIBRA_04496 [Fibroporia radiculosa]CCM02398.1 predicted protein [Fibroporia radiculosa]